MLLSVDHSNMIDRQWELTGRRVVLCSQKERSYPTGASFIIELLFRKKQSKIPVACEIERSLIPNVVRQIRR